MELRYRRARSFGLSLILCCVFLCSIADRAAGQAIDLGDVAAGGDGSGNAPAVRTGVDPRTGRFTTDYFDGPVSESDPGSDGVNPSPVPDSPYVDSVFFIGPGGDPASPTISQPITTSGVTFEFPRSAAAASGAWNYILKDRNGGVSTPGIRVGGLQDPTDSAVGIHASMGITYDLDALRDRYGASRVGCFSSFWGMDACEAGDVNLYAIFSTQAGLIAGSFRSFRALPETGEFVQMEIPPAAKYLTLATDANNSGACAHGTFAHARIVEAPCLPPSFVDLTGVEPTAVESSGGTEVTFIGKNLAPGYSYLLGGLPLADPVVVDPTRVRGKSPALPAGKHAAEVMVPGAAGVVARLRDAVTATAASPVLLSGISPAQVSVQGGTPVTITGSGLAPDMLVQIDGAALEGQILLESGAIKGLTPPLTAGKHALQLVRPGRVLAAIPGAVEAVASAGATKVNFKVQISRDDLKIEKEVGLGGTTYARVTLRGADTSDDPGLPLVPVLRKYVLVPTGSKIVSLRARPSGAIAFPDVGSLAWGQSPQPIRDPSPPVFQEGDKGIVYYPRDPAVPLNPAILELDRWPTAAALHARTFQKGEYQIAEIDLYPFQWSPQTGGGTLQTAFDISIDSVGGAYPPPPGDYASSLLAEALRDILVNPDIIAQPTRPPEVLDAPYLIVTDNKKWRDDVVPGNGIGDMVSELQRLADWKTQKGIPAKVVTIEDIVKGKYGDFKTGSRDLQEVIRKFLKRARGFFHTYYVLLAGDVDVIPARLAVMNGYWSASHYLPLTVLDPKPVVNQCYWDALTGTVRIHHQGIGPDSWIFAKRTGTKFVQRAKPSSSAPGWAYVTSDSYGVESALYTDYIVLRGPLADTELMDFYYGIPDDNMIATDLYYSDLAGPSYGLQGLHDWDLNNNLAYGQCDGLNAIDGVDGAADVLLGRAPVASATEAAHFVNKAIGYEKYEAVPAEFGRKVLYVSANFDDVPAVGKSNNNPPKEGEYYSAPNTTTANLYFKGVPGSPWQVRLVAWNGPGQGNWWVVPFNLSAGPSSLGYFFNVPYPWVPSNVVYVAGPPGQIHPATYFFDPIGADSSVVHTQALRAQLAGDAPVLDISQRLYQDILDTPGYPAGELAELTPKRVVAELNSGYNFVSLAGHGWWGGCCNLSVDSLDDLKLGTTSGVIYADSCLTAMFDYVSGGWDSFGETMLILPWLTRGGAAAYVGNSRWGWLGLGDKMELAFWKKLTQTRTLGKLHDTKESFAVNDRGIWSSYSMNLLGDPAMTLWVGSPGRLAVDYEPYRLPGEDLTVRVKDRDSNSPLLFATVCVTGPRNFFKLGYTNLNGEVVLGTQDAQLNDFLTLTVTKIDYIPYQGAVNVGGSPNAFVGDANGDKSVDISDAITILGYLFLGSADLPCPATADVNADETIDLSDAIKLLGSLFLGDSLPDTGPVGCDL